MYLLPADYDIETLKPGEAVAIDWTEAQYFGDRRTMSRSDILHCKDDPEGFDAKRTGGVEASGRKSSAMTLGTLAHIRLLEPERWHNDLGPRREAPSWWVGNQTAWTRHRKIKVANHPGCIDATDKMIDMVEAIAQRAHQNKFAASILGLEGPTELAVVWREPTTGVLCRVRLDKLGFMADGGLVIPDLKTAREIRPAAFSKAMLEHRLHVQAALYYDALCALYPDREVVWAFIAIRNRASHKVAAWPIAQRAIDLGRRVYLDALTDYARRVRDDDWLEAWEQDYKIEADLPEWHYKGQT